MEVSDVLTDVLLQEDLPLKTEHKQEIGFTPCPWREMCMPSWTLRTDGRPEKGWEAWLLSRMHVIDALVVAIHDEVGVK